MSCGSDRKCKTTFVNQPSGLYHECGLRFSGPTTQNHGSPLNGCYPPLVFEPVVFWELFWIMFWNILHGLLDAQGYFAHKKDPPPSDPTVTLCPGTYGDPMGVGVSYQRGTPVLEHEVIPSSFCKKLQYLQTSFNTSTPGTS